MNFPFFSPIFPFPAGLGLGLAFFFQSVPASRILAGSFFPAPEGLTRGFPTGSDAGVFFSPSFCLRFFSLGFPGPSPLMNISVEVLVFFFFFPSPFRFPRFGSRAWLFLVSLFHTV